MELGTLFNFAILLFCGLIFAKIIRYFKLPDVTGYLIGGLIIGPSVLGLLSADAVAGLSLVSDVALGFIAFSIGSEFKLSYFTVSYTHLCLQWGCRTRATRKM